MLLSARKKQTPNLKNRLCYLSKTENQMLKNGKTANRNAQENRKTDLKMAKN